MFSAKELERIRQTALQQAIDQKKAKAIAQIALRRAA